MDSLSSARIRTQSLRPIWGWSWRWMVRLFPPARSGAHLWGTVEKERERVGVVEHGRTSEEITCLSPDKADGLFWRTRFSIQRNFDNEGFPPTCTHFLRVAHITMRDDVTTKCLCCQINDLTLFKDLFKFRAFKDRASWRTQVGTVTGAMPRDFCNAGGMLRFHFARKR